MTTGRTVSALILVAVLGAFGAVYQFYFREKLETYKQDRLFKDELEKTYQALETDFSGYKPDVLIRAWKGVVQPWNDAIADRAKYFNCGDWYEHESAPEEGPILKFWYDDESNKMIWDFYQKVLTAMGTYNRVPADIRAMLGVPYVSEWAGINVTKQDVRLALDRLSFGLSACELLLDAKATRIDNVVLWPHRQDQKSGKLLKLHTVGLAFSMTLKDLVAFIDSLRTQDRYFNIDAMSISYRYIAYPVEPQPDIQMLLTQGEFAPPKERPGGVRSLQPSAPGGGGGGSARELFARGFGRNRPEREDRMAQKPPGPFGRAWKWFKRHVLYTN